MQCSAFEKEIIFHSHANKTRFHKKGALGLILKVSFFWNSEVAYWVDELRYLANQHSSFFDTDIF